MSRTAVDRNDVQPDHPRIRSDHRVVRPDPASAAPLRIDVPAGKTFVLIMRDDTAHCVRELSRRLTGGPAGPLGGPAPRTALGPALAEAYRDFQRDTRDTLRDVMRPSGRLEFHLVDAHRLELAVRGRAGHGPLISLDPLIERAVRPLRVSRGFLLGGRTGVGLVARPGAASLVRQLAGLPDDPTRQGYTLIEDDVCTGETLREVIGLLRATGRRVRQVVPGIRLDGTARPSILGATVAPVLQYRTVGAAGGAHAMELADPRNFLLGLSGLVVRLPDGGWGRAPYWLPFVSTAARIGTPAASDEEFALRLLEANLRFFARAERLVGRTVRVADLHPATRRLLRSLEVAQGPEPVRAVLERLMADLDRLGELIAELEERDARLPAGSAVS
ncbi:hypothetical protein OIE52_02265 [Streptomyces canus]|uniref:hypothetical protein n=1 Tax=Streptomyces canus TaxID=58343 RepID=UPI002E2A8E79|nr:hypothetical protein [Streptomyces canus]